MTAEQIAELRRLDADAKQPPWVDEGGYVFPGDPDETERESIWIFGTQDCGHPPTAEFIVAMRNAFRALLDEREALLTALKAVAAELGDARSTLSHCWASEKAPTKEDADDADTAEEAARAAIKKAEA